MGARLCWNLRLRCKLMKWAGCSGGASHGRVPSEAYIHLPACPRKEGHAASTGPAKGACAARGHLALGKGAPSSERRKRPRPRKDDVARAQEIGSGGCTSPTSRMPTAGRCSDYACTMRLAGIISKKLTSNYKSGTCETWLKVKNAGYVRRRGETSASELRCRASRACTRRCRHRG